MWFPEHQHRSAGAVPVFALTYLVISLLTTSVFALPYEARNTGDVIVSNGESIQAAIDAAGPGTTITVGAGIYAEQLTVNKDGIALVGEGAILVPPDTPVQNICTGIAGEGTGAGICVQGSDIELAPFQAEHQRVISVGQPISDVSVTGFTINGFDGENIAIVGGSNVQISGNTLLNGGQYGVLSAGSQDSVIEHNAVISADTLRFIAICTDNLPGPTLVRHNTVTGYIIGLCIQTSGSELSYNHLTGNCVGASMDPGIEGTSVTHNYIGPTHPDCAATTPFNIGILVYGSVNGVVQFNVVEGQHANMSAAGIALTDAFEISPDLVADGNVVTDNTLRDNDFDLFVNTTGTANVVVPNQCSTPEELCSI